MAAVVATRRNPDVRALDDVMPVESVRWVKDQAPAATYEVQVQNHRFHEHEPRPIEDRVEIAVDGVIQHFAGTIASKLEIGYPSNRHVHRFTSDPSAAKAPAPALPDPYEAYDDAVVHKQWDTVSGLSRL